jgi:uroporphyrinogen decarboxylase
MTSTERVLAALRGEPVDRVPTMELYIDPKVINGIHPGMSYEDFVEAEDMDGVACIAVVENMDEVEWVDRDASLYRDKWGALQQMVGDELLPLVQMPARVETDADLDNYTPPDPAKSPALRDAKRIIERFKGKRAIVAVGEATFAPQQYLRGGLENLMFDYMDRPEFVERLARVGVEYYCELYRMMIAEGVEVVLLGDDYAGKNGPMISPDNFRQFIEPGLTEVVRAIHDAGALVIKHTDGNVWPIMDSLVASGADMFGPLEPPLMDLAEVRTKTGRGVMGNVDIDLLSRGSQDQVREATLDLLRRVSPLGKHIIASGNTIASYVDPSNYKVMLDTVKEYGSKFINT